VVKTCNDNENYEERSRRHPYQYEVYPSHEPPVVRLDFRERR
jgi:hypothetical protein